jgi:hypothetical protein
MKRTESSTITTWDRLEPGCRIALDGEDLLWVIATMATGRYYTSTVRRTPTLRIRARQAWARLTRPYRAWWQSRCRPSDDRRTVCPRRETYNGRCDRHTLWAIEEGEEL